MVLSLEECTKKLTAEDKRAIKSLEERIDRKLLAEFSGEGDVCVDVPQYPSIRVQKALREMYGRAGWQLKFESDQRDGDWVRVSPRASAEAQYER